MMTLHEYAPSGNCYKARLIAALTGQPLARRHYDILKGETRTPAFLAHTNANGRIPVLELEDGTMLPESNAILIYLAHGTPWWPLDRRAQAQALQWLFFEQYSHEPNIATSRFWVAYVGEAALSEDQRRALPSKMTQGHAALAVMERHLSGRDWFAGDAPSVADIALYAYTHVAGEGGFDLAGYDAINRWLARIAALPGYVAITA